MVYTICGLFPTLGSPQYDNEYTFNAESYNPNIHSQYLRARYYDTVKGCFLTEDTYLGDIRNPLTLNRYSYCIGNPLFYSDPSGHAPRTLSSNPASPYNRIDFEARDQGIKDAILGHQDRVDEAMDHIYDWLGEEDRSSAEQFVDGFLTGFAGSFYATYDVITNPEYVIAFAYNMLNHPVRTLAAIAKSAIAGDTMELLHYIETKNYRALGQNMGYRTGKLAQIALARAAVKKCGELSNKKGGETPPLKNEGGSRAYKAPDGGGRVTSTIKANGQTINFGHGGRHLGGTSLNVNAVNQALANEVSTLNLSTGQFYKGQIVVNGITIEYTSYGVSDEIINIGTYYLLE